MATDSLLSKQCNDTFAKPYPDDGRLYCNATYDTVRCWGVTLAGTRAYGDCPKSLPQSAMFSPDGYSFKDCTKNGTWWTYPSTGKQWTNYTTCIQDKLVRANTLLYVYISGFAVSLVLLLISLIIFSIFRQLKCTRVSMHKHLFASYIVNAVLWIPYYTTLMDVQIVERNPIWCRVLHVITQYATLCNYAWMFCEGLYLHSIIAFAFTNQKRLLIICCIIGWVIPLVPTMIYALVRAFFSSNQHLSSCWKNTSGTMWIPMAPIVISLVLNFIFLVNILRILLSKLRAVNATEVHQYRRTARACLILIPLLGVQYMMMPFEPSGEAFVYRIIIAILISYQTPDITSFGKICNSDIIFDRTDFVMRCYVFHYKVGMNISPHCVISGVRPPHEVLENQLLQLPRYRTELIKDTDLKGAFVSLLFCFLNGEVIQCIKRHYKNGIGCCTRRKRRSLSTNLSIIDKTQCSVTENSIKSNGYCSIPLDDIERISDKNESVDTAD